MFMRKCVFWLKYTFDLLFCGFHFNQKARRKTAFCFYFLIFFHLCAVGWIVHWIYINKIIMFNTMRLTSIKLFRVFLLVVSRVTTNIYQTKNKTKECKTEFMLVPAVKENKWIFVYRIQTTGEEAHTSLSDVAAAVIVSHTYWFYFWPRFARVHSPPTI